MNNKVDIKSTIQNIQNKLDGVETPSKEVTDHYNTYWKSIIEPNGRINLDQLKKELFDYSFLMQEASKVYMEITGGRFSKTNYEAEQVISEYSRHLEEYVDAQVSLTMQNLRDQYR